MPQGMPIAPCGENVRLESTDLSIIKYAGALVRLPALSEEHQPQLVMVTLGGNDMLRK
jgi:lysophospholipase L1-like esterase